MLTMSSRLPILCASLLFENHMLLNITLAYPFYMFASVMHQLNSEKVEPADPHSCSRWEQGS